MIESLVENRRHRLHRQRREQRRDPEPARRRDRRGARHRRRLRRAHACASGSLDRGLASQLCRHWAVQQLTVRAALTRRSRSSRSRRRCSTRCSRRRSRSTVGACSTTCSRPTPRSFPGSRETPGVVSRGDRCVSSATYWFALCTIVQRRGQRDGIEAMSAEASWHRGNGPRGGHRAASARRASAGSLPERRRWSACSSCSRSATPSTSAFTNLELLGPTAQNYWFTGLDNLDRMVHDPVFWQSRQADADLRRRSRASSRQTVLGMALALLMRSAPPRRSGSASARSSILAWVLPEISVGVHLVRVRAGGRHARATDRPAERELPGLDAAADRVHRERLARRRLLDAGLLAPACATCPAEVDEAAQLEGASLLAPAVLGRRSRSCGRRS